MFSFASVGSVILLVVFSLSLLSLLVCTVSSSSVIQHFFSYFAQSVVKKNPARHFRLSLLRLYQCLPVIAWSQFFLLLLAFLCLLIAFLTDDFSIGYVAFQSNSQLPWLFKMGAVWGGHEGSMLLWVLLLAGWNCLTNRQLQKEGSDQTGILPFVRFSAWMHVILLAFAGFLYFLSNPFVLLPEVPVEGMDLNPLLQDVLLMVHPPVLYAGYIGTAIPFAFAMTALAEPEYAHRWLFLLRPWVYCIWALLTVGIVLGSYWAYYELGWGGWWFWDPVENISLIPWLFLAALVHALHVYVRTKQMKIWIVVLSFLIFITASFGTFLIRSGLLTSVHSFASDPERGLFLLAVVSIFTLAFLYSMMRSSSADRMEPFCFLSRPVFMLWGNVILVVAAFVLILGTLYPVFVPDVAVGAPYYYLVFVPLLFLLLILMILGISTPWHVGAAWHRFLTANIFYLLMASFIAAWLVYFMFPFWHWLVYLSFILACWLIISHVVQLYHAFLRKSCFQVIMMFFAHTGFILLVLSAVVNTIYQRELSLPVDLHQSVVLHDRSFRFDGLYYGQENNYVFVRADVMVRRGQQDMQLLQPERRLYSVRQNILSETAILPGLFADWLITLGEQITEERWMLRIQYQPFVRLIWIGACMIALAAFFSTWKKFARGRGLYTN